MNLYSHSPYGCRNIDIGASLRRSDEINLLMEKLQAAWGCVRIECAPTGSEPNAITCLVWDGNVHEGYLHAYEAPTLLEALRLAEQGSEV